jgi:hypothetical protein
MLLEDAGKLFQSNPKPWINNGQLVFELDFLNNALKRMTAPVIRKVMIHYRGSLTGSGTHDGADSYKVFSNIRLTDQGGNIVNAPGSILRLIEQMEVGGKQVDPADVANTVEDASHDVFANIFFDLEKAHRGADTALPVIHLTSGGEVVVTCGTPPTSTMGAGTVQVDILVHDERNLEAKSRMEWHVTSVTSVETDYIVKGSLRAAFIASELTTAGYTSLAAQTEVTSKTFEMNRLDAELLRQEYLAKSPTRASDDGFLAATPVALPIVTPSEGQHIGKMMDLDSFHLKIEAVPTSGKLVTCVIKDRNAELASELFGYGSVADYSNAAMKIGSVVGKGGKGTHVSNWDKVLRRRLPFRLKP